MADAAPTTRADWAYRRLRAAILCGELAPGTKLAADELAQRWTLSPTPLREAFQRLGGSGLVELSSQRGARVAAFSLAEASDLYEIRLLLEPRALEGSMAHADDGFASEVLAALARTEASLRARPLDPVEAVEAHLGFHAALLARCPSAWMRRLTALLAEQSQRYQLLGAAPALRGADPRQEHAELCDAVVRGQTARAVRLLTRHLQTTLAAVRAAMAADPPGPRSSSRTATRARRS